MRGGMYDTFAKALLRKCMTSGHLLSILASGIDGEEIRYLHGLHILDGRNLWLQVVSRILRFKN